MKIIDFLKEKGFAILLLSVIFTLGTLFWTSDIVNDHNDLSSIDLGWPVDFVSQSKSQLDPPDWWFPHSYGLGAPQEYPLHIDLGLFAFAIFVNFLIIFSVLFFVFRFNPNLYFLRDIISVKYIVGAVMLVFLGLISFLVFDSITRPQIGEGIPPPQVPESVQVQSLVPSIVIPSHELGILEDKLMVCGSIPNGTTLTLRSTSRKYINLPKDIFPDKNNNLQFKTINGNVTAGRMPAVAVGEDLEATEKCWSYRYDFNGEGEIELTATSPIKSVPVYKVYFIVE